MLFSSNVFIWLFLPITLALYYIVHFIGKDSEISIAIKNVILMVFSLIFYAWGGVYYLFIMLGSIIINYVAGYAIGILQCSEEESKNIDRVKIKEKIILTIAVLANIGMLFYFKYFNMFLSIVENIMAGDNALHNILMVKRNYGLNIKDVVLPIGISFFTFQALSYVIDVYRKVVNFQRNIINFALYVSFFPQLIAGPIVKYKEVKNYILYRHETIDKFAEGIKRFCYGLGKKVILANTFAEIVDTVWKLDLSGLGSLLAILTCILYALQLYYDFSGYSDMAIGLGKMFGFKFEENFNYPYIALSITEYWRRWHISLSTWFKEYVYISLGGNRKGKVRTFINLFIVFLSTGFWHGANFTFIIWGAIQGVVLICEKLFLLKILEKNKIKAINYIYQAGLTMFLLIIFRAENIFDAGIYMHQLITVKSSYNIFSYMSMKLIVCIILGILFMGVIQKLFYNFYNKHRNEIPVLILDYIVQIVVFVISVSMIAADTYNPFIYFRF